jgi:hypothetical protein
MKTIKRIWNYMLDTKLGFFLFQFVACSAFVTFIYDLKGLSVPIYLSIAILAMFFALITKTERWY